MVKQNGPTKTKTSIFGRGGNYEVRKKRRQFLTNKALNELKAVKRRLRNQYVRSRIQLDLGLEKGQPDLADKHYGASFQMGPDALSPPKSGQITVSDWRSPNVEPDVIVDPMHEFRSVEKLGYFPYPACIWGWTISDLPNLNSYAWYQNGSEINMDWGDGGGSGSWVMNRVWGSGSKWPMVFGNPDPNTLRKGEWRNNWRLKVNLSFSEWAGGVRFKPPNRNPGWVFKRGSAIRQPMNNSLYRAPELHKSLREWKATQAFLMSNTRHVTSGFHTQIQNLQKTERRYVRKLRDAGAQMTYRTRIYLLRLLKNL